MNDLTYYLLCGLLRPLQLLCGGGVLVEPVSVQTFADLGELFPHEFGGFRAFVDDDLRLLRERGQIEKIIYLCIICHIFSNLQYYFHVKTYTRAILARKSLKKELAVSLLAGMEVGTRAKDTGENPASPKLRRMLPQ